MPGIAQGFGDARLRMPWWLLGALIERSSNDEIRTALNKYPQAAQVSTSTVSDPGDDIDITNTINGVDVTYNTGTGEALDTIGAGIEAAINAEPLVRGQVTASYDADTDVLTLTGNTPGVAFTWTESSGAMTTPSEDTAADAADPIEFGRAVCRVGHQDTDELVAKAASGLFTAQVITASIAFVDAAVITIRVYEVRGVERVLIAAVDEASATNRDTTVDALVALLETALPANSVSAAADNASATAIVFTAEVAGLEFDVEIEAGHEGASLPAVSVAYTTGPSEATSFHRAFRGITLRDQAIGAETIAGTEQRYLANSALAYVRRGVVAVESSQSPGAGDIVYVELGVTADNGKFFTDDSATRIAVSRQVLRWELDANTATGSLAALRVL
jgi:hypothetical protein